MLTFFLGAYSLYYAVQLVGVWLPFLAACFARHKISPAGEVPAQKPFFYIVAPCRDSTESIPGLVECLRKQTYPTDRYRILIIADNCTDHSAEVARSLGVEVYERTHSEIKTKSAALNEFLSKQLRQESFDVLLMFDIDGRVAPDFLVRAAAHWKPGPLVIQGLHQSLNASENALTRIEDVIAEMLRYRQIGRAVFGWTAYLVGGHGLMLTRAALDRLDWKLCEGRNLTEDTELILRCYLRNVPMRYATDLAVANELPATSQSIRTQRRRWGTGTIELVGEYLGPLLKRGLRGDIGALQIILDLLIAPPLSLFWVVTGALCGVLVWRRSQIPMVNPLLVILTSLFLLHALYYGVVLALWSEVWHWRDVTSVFVYFGVRVRAVLESIGLTFVKGDRWVPTPHGPNRHKKDLI